ncbi:MAG: hypothetical protein ACOVOO_11810 [Flavobacteriales bacterium]|jgi:hypothetical protein
MQKVIIPALALLIGMALGALLMKNSTNSSFTWDAGNNLAPKDTEPIKINEAFSFFNTYINNPIYSSSVPDADSPCLGTKQALYGWSIDYKKLKTLEDYYGDKISRLSLIIGKDEGNAHTIIIVPEDDSQNLMIGDNLMLEYVRPCPPRCKSTVQFYEIDPSNGKARYTGIEKKYDASQNCMQNPFAQ